jgi:hypothetical protein
MLGMLSIAGCVSSGATTAGPAAAVSAAFDDATGSIRGLVQTEDLAPIAGAQVGVLGTKIIGTTDAGGAYGLSYVPPGKAALAVQALGYASMSRSVDVVAGQIVENTNFVLAALPSLAPYHTTGIFQLRIGGAMVKPTPDCMFVTVPGQSSATTKTCQGTNACSLPGCSAGNPEQRYGYCKSGGDWGKNGCDLTPEWKSLVGELAWTPQSGVTGRGWIFELLAPNVTRSGGDTGSVDQQDFHDWMAIGSKSPIRHRIDDETFAKGSPNGKQHPIVYPNDRCGGVNIEYPHCNWVWRVFPGWCTIGGLSGGLAGCEHTGPDFALDQGGNPVTVYFTYFIREAAPPNFSAVPDA